VLAARMWRRCAGYAAVAVGGLLTAIGIIPLTPLVWLLVLVQIPMKIPFRLQFWQTQSIALGILVIGVGIAWAGLRLARSGR